MNSETENIYEQRFREYKKEGENISLNLNKSLKFGYIKLRQKKKKKNMNYFLKNLRTSEEIY